MTSRFFTPTAHSLEEANITEIAAREKNSAECHAYACPMDSCVHSVCDGALHGVMFGEALSCKVWV